MVANSHRKDGSIGTDRYIIADAGRLPLFGSALCRSTGAEKIIDKHDAVSYEAMVADPDQFADKGVRLYFTMIADPAILLDLYKWADEAMVADPAAV